MTKRKNGMPRTTPDLSIEPPRPEVVEGTKVWVFNYEIRLNSIAIRDSIMVPRGYNREQAGEAVAQRMMFSLTKILREAFVN